jgi:hypothetical protein
MRLALALQLAAPGDSLVAAVHCLRHKVAAGHAGESWERLWLAAVARVETVLRLLRSARQAGAAKVGDKRLRSRQQLAQLMQELLGVEA